MSTADLKKIFAANLNRLAAGRSQAQMAGLIGVKQPQYQRWSSGEMLPRSDRLRSIAKILGVSETELLSTEAETNAREVEMPRSSKAVPLISWARAGEFIDYEDLCRQIEEWVDADTKDPNAFAVEIEGDSMEPRFCAGDRVVVSPNAEPRNGDFVVARLNTGGVVFKRHRRFGPNSSMVRLESLNDSYAPLELKVTEFAWIYPVISVVVQLRR